MDKAIVILMLGMVLVAGCAQKGETTDRNQAKVTVDTYINTSALNESERDVETTQIEGEVTGVEGLFSDW